MNNLSEIKVDYAVGSSFSRYSEKCYTQSYRALYGDAVLAPPGKSPPLNELYWYLRPHKKGMVYAL